MNRYVIVVDARSDETISLGIAQLTKFEDIHLVSLKKAFTEEDENPSMPTVREFRARTTGEKLAERRQKVYAMFEEGKSAVEIARALGLTESTVRSDRVLASRELESAAL